MTLQELNDYVMGIIQENDLKNSCGFYLYDNDTSEPIHRYYGGEPYDWFAGVYRDAYDTIVIRLIGGLNGPATWVNYLGGISIIIDKLNQLPEIKNAYIVELENDCLDDVFDAIIGVRPSSEDSFEE